MAAIRTTDATLMVMGGIIGVGIFFNPGQVAERVDSEWIYLALWLFGGLVALCAAFTFAELAASFPRAGGWFVYLREAFGRLPAFLFAWVVLLVVSTAALASMAVFMADMLHRGLPHFVGAGGSPSHTVLAASLLIGLTLLALSGLRQATRFQSLCMVIKLVAIAALVLGGLLLATPLAEQVSSAASALPNANPVGSTSLAAAFMPVLFSFGGWQMVCYVASEVEDPERSLPRAIVFGVGGVLVVYLALGLAFLRALGLEGMAASASGVGPDLAKAAFGPLGERLLSLGMALSALGVATVSTLATPWLYVAMSREGLFFRSFGTLDPRRRTPAVALICQGLLALAYLALLTASSLDLDFLVDSVIFVEWIFHGAVALALLHLRRTRPRLSRPYRSPLYPAAPLAYLACALFVVVGNLYDFEPKRVAVGLFVVLAGVLAYLPWRNHSAPSDHD